MKLNVGAKLGAASSLNLAPEYYGALPVFDFDTISLPRAKMDTCDAHAELIFSNLYYLPSWYVLGRSNQGNL